MIAIVTVVHCRVAVGLQRPDDENELLRQENGRLRGELGELKIEPGTEAPLQVIVVPTVEAHDLEMARSRSAKKKLLGLPRTWASNNSSRFLLKRIGLTLASTLVIVAFRPQCEKSNGNCSFKTEATQPLLGVYRQTGLPAKDARPLIEHHITYSECAGDGHRSSFYRSRQDPLQLLRYRDLLGTNPPSHQFREMIQPTASSLDLRRSAEPLNYRIIFLKSRRLNDPAQFAYILIVPGCDPFAG